MSGTTKQERRAEDVRQRGIAKSRRPTTPITATLGEMLARKRFGEDNDPVERAVAIRDAQTSTELLKPAGTEDRP